MPGFAEKGRETMRTAGQVNLRQAVGSSIVAAFLAFPAVAQMSLPTTFVDDRHVVLLPRDASEFSGVSMSGMIDVGITTGDRMRIYRATYEGRTHTAYVDLAGPPVRYAFDPVQRRFRAVSPTVRVELSDYGDLDAIAREQGAVIAKAYPQLGLRSAQTRRPDGRGWRG